MADSRFQTDEIIKIEVSKERLIEVIKALKDWYGGWWGSDQEAYVDYLEDEFDKHFQVNVGEFQS